VIKRFGGNAKRIMNEKQGSIKEINRMEREVHVLIVQGKEQVKIITFLRNSLRLLKNGILKKMGITIFRIRERGLDKIHSDDLIYKDKDSTLLLIKKLLENILSRVTFPPNQKRKITN
jgi:hypothetical protein